MKDPLEILKIAVLLIIVTVVQIKLSFLYSIYGIKPDLLLIILIRLSMKYPKPHISLTFGFFTGLVNDLLVGDVIGISSLSYSIACFFVSYFRRGKGFIPSEKLFLFYILPIVFSALLIYPVTLSGLDITYNLSRVILPSILYTSVISLFFQIFKPVR